MRDRTSIGIAATACSIGVAAVLCDHYQTSRSLLTGMHVLFGVVTAGAIYCVLVAKAREVTSASPWELRLSTRMVSRWVYILMYALALVRLCLGSVRSIDDFQLYVACSVIPLWVFRALILASPPERGRGFELTVRPVSQSSIS